MKRYLPILLLLSACNGAVPIGSLPSAQPSPTASAQTGDKTLFGNAQQKRTLSLGLFANGATAQNSGNASSDNAATSPNKGGMPPAMAESSGVAQPVAAPMPGMAAGRGAMAEDAKMSGLWFGGGEFNQYVLQYAEENVFGASSAQTLLTAYRDTVEPLLKDWDASARLSESRAHLGSGIGEEEYFYLPNASGEPERIQVKYLFRFASSARKETLVVYLTDTDTRVHRLVWGEPNLDLSKVGLDSNQAVETARKALTSRESKPGYPVYPDQSYPEMEILYTIPTTARWQVQLNQHSGSSRYFVSVNFESAINGEKQTVHGSVEIDAISGNIQQVNRPTLYRAVKPYSVDPGMPIAMPMPAIDPVR